MQPLLPPTPVLLALPLLFAMLTLPSATLRAPPIEGRPSARHACAITAFGGSRGDLGRVMLMMIVRASMRVRVNVR